MWTRSQRRLSRFRDGDLRLRGVVGRFCGEISGGFVVCVVWSGSGGLFEEVGVGLVLECLLGMIGMECGTGDV